MELISSVKNPKIVEAVSLRNVKERKKRSQFTADGIKLINEAIKSGYELNSCFLREGADVSLLLGEHKSVYFVTDNVLKKLSDFSTPQDFFAVFESKPYNTDIFDKTVLALDAVQDPSNVGAVLRSAEAFGIRTVLLGAGCADLFSSKTLRAAMGSAFRLNAFSCDLEVVLPQYKVKGYEIIGTGLNKNYKTTECLCEYENKVIIIGNEGNGISGEIQNLCDFGMYIPMTGENESLNAAVAASIIIWEDQRLNYE